MREACHGKTRCQLTASNEQFGEPCYGTTKFLAVAISCSGGQHKAHGHKGRQEL